MKALSTNKKNSKKVYNSALLGAYFGIFNVFYVFIPFLTSLKDNSLLFTIYLIMGILILVGFVCVPVFYKSSYRYDILKLRYLLFLSISTLTFYLGLAVCLYIRFTDSLTFTNIYIMLLYVILSVMSSLDILSSVNKGFSYIKRLYTRTYRKHFIYNIIISLLSVLTGVLFLLPQILL